ncbi:hypothetical protein K402DRAFT_14255 [Aulographum hederae CBS 113979]|uniref:Uncharacterized protein n=1 Tax=Aulographum hederae CBS 113979 TaxID=1176131 RepID=A0A6G1H7G8_9PEZI|nr:hypothetical protein K402DRAFT_14255 [Aulographum hederae CBS 113979]
MGILFHATTSSSLVLSRVHMLLVGPDRQWRRGEVERKKGGVAVWRSYTRRAVLAGRGRGSTEKGDLCGRRCGEKARCVLIFYPSRQD